MYINVNIETLLFDLREITNLRWLILLFLWRYPFVWVSFGYFVLLFTAFIVSTQDTIKQYLSVKCELNLNVLPVLHVCGDVFQPASGGWVEFTLIRCIYSGCVLCPSVCWLWWQSVCLGSV